MMEPIEKLWHAGLNINVWWMIIRKMRNLYFYPPNQSTRVSKFWTIKAMENWKKDPKAVKLISSTMNNWISKIIDIFHWFIASIVCECVLIFFLRFLTREIEEKNRSTLPHVSSLKWKRNGFFGGLKCEKNGDTKWKLLHHHIVDGELTYIYNMRKIDRDIFIK